MLDVPLTPGFSVQTDSGQTSPNATPSPTFLLQFLQTLHSLISTNTPQNSILHTTSSRIQACLTYFISPFALVWIGMAIVLHRILIFASTRQPASISRVSVIILRMMALYLLLQSYLPVLNLFTSSFVLSASKTGPLSVLAALAVRFQNLNPTVVAPENPPKVVLWQLYISMCISQCVDAFLNVIQNLPAFVPWGMSPFHYSIAFYEAHSLNRYNLQLFAVASIGALSPTCNHLISLLGLERYRLIPSSIIGATFLSYYIYCLFSGSLFEFPSICVPTFMPQVLLILMASVGSAIHLLALVTCKNRSHLNVQTLEALSRLSLSDDFDRFLTEFSDIAVMSLHGLAYFNKNCNVRAPLRISSNQRSMNTAYNRETKALDPIPKLSASYFEGPTIIERVKRAASITASAHWAIRANVIHLYRSLACATTPHCRPACTDLDKEETHRFYAGHGLLLDETDDTEEYKQPPHDDSDTDSLSDTDDAVEAAVELLDLLKDSSTSILSLLKPSSSTDRVMAEHLRSDGGGIVTRSKLRSEHTDILDNELRRATGLVGGTHTLADSHVQCENESMCVVCYTSRRDIIVWPCRCFGICDDCRSALARKNYNTCVCCRRPVESYSKIYVL